MVDRIGALQAGDVSFEEFAPDPMTIPADTRINQSVDQVQTEHQELALLLDDGALVGLITATDALEAVIGEIEDPLDRRIAEVQPYFDRFGS